MLGVGIGNPKGVQFHRYAKGPLKDFVNPLINKGSSIYISPKHDDVLFEMLSKKKCYEYSSLGESLWSFESDSVWVIREVSLSFYELIEGDLTELLNMIDLVPSNVPVQCVRDQNGFSVVHGLAVVGAVKSFKKFFFGKNYGNTGSILSSAILACQFKFIDLLLDDEGFRADGYFDFNLHYNYFLSIFKYRLADKLCQVLRKVQLNYNITEGDQSYGDMNNTLSEENVLLREAIDKWISKDIVSEVVSLQGLICNEIVTSIYEDNDYLSKNYISMSPETITMVLMGIVTFPLPFGSQLKLFNHILKDKNIKSMVSEEVITKAYLIYDAFCRYFLNIFSVRTPNNRWHKYSRINFELNGFGLINIFDHIDDFYYHPYDFFDNEYINIFPSDRTPLQPSIVSSEQFKINFNAFTRGQLDIISDLGLVVIGSTVGACLSPIPSMYLGKETEYFDKHPYWSSSDIDLCFVEQETDEEIYQKMCVLHDFLVQNFPTNNVTIISNNESVTFTMHYPYRTIQIMGTFESLQDVLYDVDIDVTSLAYDGKTVYATHRSAVALNRKWSIASPEFYSIKGCPGYERRLLKYANRGFSIVDLNLTREYVSNKIDLKEPEKELNFSFIWRYQPHTLIPGNGLYLLLLCEKFEWVTKKLYNMKLDSVPYGPGINADNISQFIRQPDYENIDENNENENNYDRYTNYYSPPTLCETVPSRFQIQGRNKSPYLIPYWYQGIEIPSTISSHRLNLKYTEVAVNGSNFKTFFLDNCSLSVKQLLMYIEGGELDVNDVNLQGENILLYAIKKSAHVSILKNLVEIGANISIRSNGNGPMHYAANINSNSYFSLTNDLPNHAKMIKYFASLGLDTEEKNNEGLTPLLISLKQSGWEIVEVLLSLSEDKMITDNEGNNGLICSVDNIHLTFDQKKSMFKIFDPFQRNNAGFDAFYYFLKRFEFGRNSYVEFILENYKWEDLVTEDGDSIIFSQITSSIYPETLKTILFHETLEDTIFHERDASGNTVLHYLARKGIPIAIIWQKLKEKQSLVEKLIYTTNDIGETPIFSNMDRETEIVLISFIQKQFKLKRNESPETYTIKAIPNIETLNKKIGQLLFGYSYVELLNEDLTELTVQNIIDLPHGATIIVR